MPKSLLIPITNVYAKGDYTAEVRVGSHQQTVNLVLDTGSSTMVVQREDYAAEQDNHLQATSYAQDITYGMGGWYGPVIQTSVDIGHSLFKASLTSVHIAFTAKEETGCFGQADGLLGLAYHQLNPAYDMSSYLEENQINPPHTYPWHLEAEQQDDNVREFRQFLKGFPRQEITPYFTELEEQGVVGNQFAFDIHRSSIYQTDQQRSLEELKAHPLNQGTFILGQPQLHKLHKGEFRKVKVLHEKYYNVNMLSMQVGDCSPRQAPALETKYQKGYITNAIVDSGASGIQLPKSLFEDLLTDLISINPKFAPLLENFRTFQGKEIGVDIGEVNLKEWPLIYLNFEGFDNSIVRLCLTPNTYWQTHAPEPNQISFKFFNLPNWPNQSILGLPLLNNYYTIFDRQKQENGQILFADKQFALHKLCDQVHQHVEKFTRYCAEHSPFSHD